MAKRHKDAQAIQAGACNPSGITHSLLRAFEEIRAEPNQGTKSLTDDPAVRLMVHQLAFICGVITGAENQFRGGDTWDACMQTCREQNKPPPFPEGVTVVGFEDPAALHDAIKNAVDE